MASYLPNILTKPLAHGGDLLRSTIGSLSWGPAVSLSKAAVTSLFSRIEFGTLVIIDESTGERSSYGQRLSREQSTLTYGINGLDGPQKKHGKVELWVMKEAFWVRLALFGDMGFAESYMLGEVECADLTEFFEV